MTTTKTPTKIIELASTQGFCAGVSNAIEIVELALQKYKTPLFVRHHIVHNTKVIKDLEARGVIFIENLSDVPDNKPVIFSAHGTSPEIYTEAKKRNIHIIDATCPLVTKVHRGADSYSKKNYHIILIGHKGHQELIGTAGHIPKNKRHIIECIEDIEKLNIPSNEPLAYLTQTTLSIRDTMGMIQKLKQKYPHIQGPSKSDICFATQNRQDAVLDLCERCDIIIVCGSPASSNSNRLKECAQEKNVESYIIDNAEELKLSWLINKSHIGITSGASVPQSIVNNVIDKIKKEWPSITIIQKKSKEKNTKFKLPPI
ncbi:MAG: 4-hydroxy-3-methylbut-2-enyl diphosphate reductase [bacterium]